MAGTLKPNPKPCWHCDNPTHYRDDGRYTGFCAVHEQEIERLEPRWFDKLLRLSTPSARFEDRYEVIRVCREIVDLASRGVISEAKP